MVQLAGDNLFDVTTAASGSTLTFTFKTRSGTASYSPKVTVEHVGSSVDSTYF